MIRWFLSIVLCMMGSGLGHAAILGQANHAEPITYTIRLTSAGAIQIEMDFRGSSSGETVLHVTSSWGGVTAGGEDLCDLTAKSQGQSLQTQRIDVHQWSVHHSADADLIVRYHIRPNLHQSSDETNTARRPIVNERIFHGVGELFLLHPQHWGNRDIRPMQIQFAGFEEAGWRMACSFGVGTTPIQVPMSLSKLLQSTWLAGDIQILEEEVHGKPFFVAIDSRGFDFTPDEFAKLAAEIMASERQFFGDFDCPYYLVTLIPVGSRRNDTLSLAGFGLTDSNALAFNPGIKLSPRDSSQYDQIAMLMAHEMFHHWNGQIIQRRHPEELVYWFTEGFTEFFARRIMLRNGFFTPAVYVDFTNQSLRSYYTSSAKNATNEQVLRSVRGDIDMADISGPRGDVVAMIIDHVIRQKSKGKRSLDNVMRAVADHARTPGTFITTETLFEVIEAETGPEFMTRLRAMIIDGETASLGEDFGQPGLELLQVATGEFDLGFDYSASSPAKIVQGVIIGSRAHQAGLRDGQVITGYTIQFGQPNQEVTIEVLEGDEARVILYLPVLEETIIPQFRLVREDVDCSGF